MLKCVKVPEHSGIPAELTYLRNQRIQVLPVFK